MAKRTVSLFVSVLVAFFCVSVFAADATYVGNDKCKMCHNKTSTGAQYKKWTEMKHSMAYKTLTMDAAKKAAVERGITVPPNEAPQCLKCHVTAYDEKKKAAPKAIKKEFGIQCETCHGPASNHIAEAKKAMMTGKSDDVKGLPFTSDEKFCKKCHNDESPNWDPAAYTTKDGKKVGFDFEQAKKKIAHPNPKKK